MSISPDRFSFLTDRLNLKAGILLEGKKIMAASPLSKIVIESLTTIETFWFRDHHHFELFNEKILASIQKEKNQNKTMRIWSAACSAGQEPYSIAIILKYHFAQLETWKLKILATDLKEKMVAMAASGKYDISEINRGLPPHYRKH